MTRRAYVAAERGLRGNRTAEFSQVSSCSQVSCCGGGVGFSQSHGSRHESCLPPVRNLSLPPAFRARTSSPQQGLHPCEWSTRVRCRSGRTEARHEPACVRAHTLCKLQCSRQLQNSGTHIDLCEGGGWGVCGLPTKHAVVEQQHHSNLQTSHTNSPLNTHIRT